MQDKRLLEEAKRVLDDVGPRVEHCAGRDSTPRVRAARLMIAAAMRYADLDSLSVRALICDESFPNPLA